MSSRFRTYCQDLYHAAFHQESSTERLRLCAETAPTLFCLLLTALLIISNFALKNTAQAATPIGTTISNTAVATYADGTASGRISKNSNTVSVTTVGSRTPSTTRFYNYAPQHPQGTTLVTVVPGAYRPGSNPSLPFLPLPPPIAVGSTTPIDLTKPVPLVPATLYHVGEPVFVEVTDLDQNLDPTLTETVFTTIKDDITGDTEVILLTETGPNTGIFIGYIQSTANAGINSYNGTLPVSVESTVDAHYTDIVDGSDSSADTVLVDPYGIVFDSSNGTPVDGASVTLINTATNSPATVFADDGVTPFPATVITGKPTVVNGVTYMVPPGGYRFPFVNPGNYRFQISPPSGYTAPTTSSDAALQALPGAPFALVTPGSRLEPFTINPGPALHIDIPIDPAPVTLWMQKYSGSDIVAIGEFLSYQLELQNAHTFATAPAVLVIDTLPLGMRYRKGSTNINGTKAPDPAISADGRTLTYSVGDLAAKATVSIRYVVEVSAGVKIGTATNQVMARAANGISSNLASKKVAVRSDFMQSHSIIMGEMIVGPCEAPLDKAKLDLSGIRILLEDGTYVITDINGMYHFEGVKPGTRVVQLDLDSIPRKYEVLACEENSRFAKRSFSQFVDIQGGVLWRADFYLGLKEKVTGEVGLELQSRLLKEENASANSDTVEYTVPIKIGPVPVHNLRLTVMLADSLAYLPATSSLDSKPLEDPADAAGALTYRLGDFPENWQGTVRLQVSVPRAGAAGQLATKALLTFDTPEKVNVRTPVADNALNRKSVDSGKATVKEEPVKEIKSFQRIAMPEIILFPHFPTFGAELTDADRQMIESLSLQLTGLDIEAVTITGHTDNVRIAPRSRHIYPDNVALSKARAESVGKFLVNTLHLPADKFSYFGKGMTEPVADNRTAEGKARNRRVEVKIRTAKPVAVPPVEPVKEQAVKAPAENSSNEVVNEKDKSGVKSVPTVGLRPGEQWLAAKTESESGTAAMPNYGAAWLNKAAAGSSWLWPPVSYHPQFPIANLAIKHDPRNTLKLLQNGAEVDPVSFDGILKRNDNTLAVSQWQGVHLIDGDNVFEAVETGENGKELSRLKQIIHYSTPPVKAELVPEKSRLVADGKTPPVIAVRLLDKDGHPGRPGTLGEFDLDPPYISLARVNELMNGALPSSSGGKLKYKIGVDGIALIELQPTPKADEAVLRFSLISGSQELRARLEPDYRDWVLVGLAEGTAGYNTISGNMESLHASSNDENFYDKERIAFFAKGTIKGEWLLTTAYDSKKQRTGVTGNGLFQTIDPNSYYTVYGDGSSQMYDAASQSKLYVKIERDQFYALYGDYDTGLTVAELSRYSRRMNGIKSEYRSKNFDATVFGSETAQSFVKDELRGDGTSGLYRLTKKGLVVNSEKITLESRDRFHSEVITNTIQLNRFIDYSVDYDNGTIYFKSPVPNRDDKFNPVYIVVDYEVLNAGSEAHTYGGRATARALNGKIEVGGTYVREGQVSGENKLYGVDATAFIAPGTKARAEFATTNNNAATKSNGNAYLAEITHTGKSFDGRAYFREQESGFGIGQQNTSETGTRKLGVDAGYRLNQKVTLNGQAYRQYNLADNAVRDFMEALAVYNEKQYSLRSGLRYANDTLPDGKNATSVLGTVGGSWRTENQKFTLRADHDQALYNKNANTDYPTRTIFGVDFQATKETTLFAQEELTYGDAANTNTTRVGVKTTPWSGGTLNSSVVNDMRENSERTFANVGLTQRMQLNPQWAVDGAIDHSETIHEKTGYTMNANVPPASGGENFTAVSMGANYTRKKLTWSNRVEYRNSDTNDKWGLVSGLINEHGLDWAWTGRLQLYHTQSSAGNSSTTGDLRFGLVYRPPLTKWIVLNRLDLIGSDLKSATDTAKGRRIINNLNANYKPNKKTQISFQYGAKYVLDKVDNKEYRGYTDLIAIEGRYDITKEWDLGARASLLHSWETDQYAYSFGPSVGYNVMENAWISAGYNVAGFTDKDFSEANYTAQGPFIQYRFKFDQNSVKDGLKAIGK